MIKSECYVGCTIKTWGVELTVDFYDGFNISIRLGPFYLGIYFWKEK